MGKVLVVDDEKSIRVTLCELLRREGIEADYAANAFETYQMIDSNSYDVIITDIIMPHQSGIEMLTKIREKSDVVQIIVMTGEPTVETAVEAVRNGANDYLVKPINKENLLKTVRQAVRIKALQDQKLRLEKENQIYQKNLEHIVENRTRALANAIQGIIFLLSSVVEIRDPYTAGHQRKVGNLAVAIAQKIGLNDKMINCLRIIGYIHDIGKIVVPIEILAKPGRLSSLEMEMIRSHPQHGYEMLKRVDLPGIIAETVYQHHERCDGSGYPRSLSVQDILPETRVIMVADVVEAMMSHRPYRPALGIDAALNEIRGNAGRLFDPRVVAACVELFEKDRYVLDDVEHKIYLPI